MFKTEEAGSSLVVQWLRLLLPLEKPLMVGKIEGRKRRG